MGIRTPSGLIRDPERTKSGGSNRLEVGLSDAEADAIWKDRYAHTVNDINDGDGEILVDNDFVFDFVVGSTWRVRAGSGGSTDNDGLFTIGPGVEYDETGGAGGGPVTKVPVEGSLVVANLTDPVFFEPVTLAGGWHKISPHLGGGTITHDRDVDRKFDETDTEIAEVVNNDEYAIARTVMPNSEWFKLLLTWFENNHSEVRDFLPVDSDGQYYSPSTSNDLYGELRAYPHVSAQKESYEENVARDEDRTHELTLNATKAPAGNANAGQIAVPDHGAQVVNIDDQTGWPSELSAFKTDAYTTSRMTS